MMPFVFRLRLQRYMAFELHVFIITLIHIEYRSIHTITNVYIKDQL